MKYIIIFLLSVFASSILLGQDKSELKYHSRNLYNLTPSPLLTDDQKVLILISELINYGDLFKYSDELSKGQYVVEKEKDKYLVKIFNDVITTNKYLSNSFKEIIVISKINKEFVSSDLKVSSNNEFIIENIEKIINLDLLISASEKDALPFPRYELVYRNNVLVDKKLLNGVVPSGQTHILNRERTRAFLRHNNQPADIFADATDGVIVPDDLGQNSKVFTVDRMWNRIIYTNKQYTQSMGNKMFDNYGHEGTNLGEFKYPSGIEFGHLDGYGFRKIYVADFGNKRIQELGYSFSNGHLWQQSIFLENLSAPYDLAYHTGPIPDNISTNDNNLWVSHLGESKYIKCYNTYNKLVVYTLNQFTYNNNLYNVNPGRLDTYVEYQSDSPVRSMLAYVDETLNAVVLFHLNLGGVIPTSQNPIPFDVFRLPTNENITSVKFISHLSGSINPVGVLVTSNDENGEGHLHLFKVRFLPGNYTTPISLEYLSSTKKTRVGAPSYYSETFALLNNIEAQTNYVDIVTNESWNNEKGIRHSKMGVDVKSFQKDEDYCRSTGINFKINLTNPVKIRIQTLHKCPNTSYQQYGFYANGLYTSSGEHYLLAGMNNLRIKVNHPNCTGDSEPTENVKILMYLLPLDENNNSSLDREYYEFVQGVIDCGTGGGCPFVYVFDGNEFEEDNNILHKSELPENEGYDIVDKYLLRVPPYVDSTDNSIHLKIKELNNDYSYFDQVKLVAIDHPVGTKLGVSESNDVVLYYPDVFSSPSYAENDGEDVTEDLGYDTTTSGEGVGGGDTSETKGEYGDGDGDSDSGFKKAIDKFYNFFAGIFRTESKKAINNSPRSTSDSVAVILDPQHPTDAIINVSSKADHTGYITAYDTESDYSSGSIPFSKRQNRSDVIIPVGSNIYVDTLGIDWNSDYSMTYLATNQIFYSGFNEYELDLLEADNTTAGDILDLLLITDENYAELDNSGEITLKFQGRDTLPPDGWERKYLFVVNGRYINVEDQQRLTGIEDNNFPVIFRLHQNYPNPFNPTTTIKFDLPKDGLTNFAVYDILGREVFKSNTFYKAGYNEVRFNGANLASGVYFYKIEVGEFKDIKRMMLIK